jgi:hypothetical protein
MTGTTLQRYIWSGLRRDTCGTLFPAIRTSYRTQGSAAASRLLKIWSPRQRTNHLGIIIPEKVSSLSDTGTDRHDSHEIRGQKACYNAAGMERIFLTKICIGVAGFAALAVLILTGRLDAALPFAALALGFALYGTRSGRRGG